MILNIDQIRSITKGAVRVAEQEDGVRFYRFTEEQMEMYREYDADFWNKSFATACVRMEFVTDSTSLFLDTEIRSASSRTYFNVDVSVNGALVGQMGSSTVNHGFFAKQFDLGEGEKTVKIDFPWSAALILREMTLDDDAALIPVQKSKTMLMYGDSITHGYCAMDPSKSYASRLTDAMGVETFNKAIGGELFNPPLARLKDDVCPDYVTVAYGTNDWSKSPDKETFDRKCRAFYSALSENYPNAKIFAITPIWRADRDKEKNLPSLDYVAEFIAEVAKELPNVTVLNGYDYVPHDESFFQDLYLHPNDEGFEHYFQNLYRDIQKHIS